jgi:hypothetical protein
MACGDAEKNRLLFRIDDLERYHRFYIVKLFSFKCDFSYLNVKAETY